MPFESNTLDYISACHLLEHILSPKKALVEWARVLKESGHLFIVVPDAGRDLKRAVLYWEHTSWFTLDILKVLIQSWLGFKIYHLEARDDLADGPMIFCYSTKPENWAKPRMPI